MFHFVIRTDASNSIGTGHVIRCLTLADALARNGAQVSFICREHEGHLCDLIEKRGYPVHRLPKPIDTANTDSGLSHAAWLGAHWQQDADQTSACIQSLEPDWLIIDHYGVDYRWERIIRPLVSRIFVIDDLADRDHDCDVLLDQNLFTDMQTRYSGMVPKNCTFLLGPDYALLQPVYADLHDRIPSRVGTIRRIFISFGGADSDNLTGRTLAAFSNLKRTDIEVDVALSENSPHTAAIERQIVEHPNIHVYGALPTLAPLMAKADLSIGAAGTTTWERLCLGLPAIVITLAENQRPIVDGLTGKGLIRYLGHKDEVSVQDIQQALSEQIKDELDENWSIKCRQIVDGRGVDRVCAVLTATPDMPLRVRHARLSDEELLLTWANDPMTQQYSFSSEPIPEETHRKWFHERLRDIESCSIYIVETKSGIPLGQVRFEKEEQVWELHYVVSPIFRGMDLGKTFLNTALLKFREENSGVLVFGRVKTENIRSQRIFEGLGFTGKPDGGGWRISVCSDSGSWMSAYIPDLLINWMFEGHEVRWAHDASELPEGDISFYLSYGKIVNDTLLLRHSNNLVIHASDLPRGRGWSPMTWKIIEGENDIAVTLFEAAESVDSGQIYKQVHLEYTGVELIDKLRSSLAQATIELCRSFLQDYPAITKEGIPQQGTPTYYPRRHHEDSFIDINKPLRDQFNLLRTVDNVKYPAWFELKGKRFIIQIYRAVNDEPKTEAHNDR